VGLSHSINSLQSASSHRQKVVQTGTLSCTLDTKHVSHCLRGYWFTA